MATTFLEPGGDTTGAIETIFWPTQWGTPTAVTDFVHGTHVNSLKFPVGATSNGLQAPNGIVSDAGARMSVYVYITSMPNASVQLLVMATTGGAATVLNVYITSGGVLHLRNSAGTQIGSNGATLLTNKWYRISLAYTITSTTVNRVELFVDGLSSISITNATLVTIVSSTFFIGNNAGNTTFDFRASDFYVDNLATLTDPGNIWVTAKRPFANGTTNAFTVIGSGGSGYGSGNAVLVNERPKNSANGWQAPLSSALTEEYNIEGRKIGDINIGVSDVVDYMGWFFANSSGTNAAQFIMDGANTAVSVSTLQIYTAFKGAAAYPLGTGTDIGFISDGTANTLNIYECGLIFAFIPGSGVPFALSKYGRAVRPHMFSPGTAR